MGRHLHQVLAVKKNLPCVWRQMTHDAAQGAGFTRTVAPDQAHHLTLAHLQAQSAQDLRGSDINMHIAKLKHGARPRAVARR